MREINKMQCCRRLIWAMPPAAIHGNITDRMSKHSGVRQVEASNNKSYWATIKAQRKAQTVDFLSEFLVALKLYGIYVYYVHALSLLLLIYKIGRCRSKCDVTFVINIRTQIGILHVTYYCKYYCICHKLNTILYKIYISRRHIISYTAISYVPYVS